jgi:hypothetical protein
MGKHRAQAAPRADAAAAGQTVFEGRVMDDAEIMARHGTRLGASRAKRRQLLMRDDTARSPIGEPLEPRSRLGLPFEDDLPVLVHDAHRRFFCETSSPTHCFMIAANPSPPRCCCIRRERHARDCALLLRDFRDPRGVELLVAADQFPHNALSERDCLIVIS